MTATSEWVTAADTAKLIRGALHRAFPGVRFSVRTNTYAGGASVDVRWSDGPSRKAVEKVADAYAGGRFDGMIDLAYGVTHVLFADGSVALAHSPGTEGSRGSHPAVHGIAELGEVVAGARLVHFGANHVFCNRDLSDGAREAVAAWVALHSQQDEAPGPSAAYCQDPLGHLGRSDWQLDEAMTWWAAERLARRADVAAGALTEEQAIYGY